MKSRLYLVTAAACAAMALGAPIAQAHVQGNWSYGAAVKSISSLNHHAIRPDDRSGARGT